jgi:TolB protein
VYVADVRTSKTRRVTRQRTPHDAVGSFAWSPDGKWIAYSGGKGGWNDDAYNDIWVVSSDSGRPRRLTDTYEDDWNPSWSPDGKQLAFDRNDDGRNWIYVVNSDGTGLRRLTGIYNWSAVWTADGRISYTNDRGIWVVNPDGTDRHLLARANVDLSAGGTPLAWSPDGGAIAFTTGTALWVMGAHGSGRHKIFGDSKRETRTPVWSPDGSRIAWTQGDGDLEIYAANRDGTDVRHVTDNTGVTDEAPTWSSDSRSIVFSRRCGNESRSWRSALLVVDAEGGEAAKLSPPQGISAAAGSYPTWASPPQP